MVGQEVTEAVLAVLNSDGELSGKNESNVVLISKKATPEFVFDLRPICLCNVIDKLVYKALANRTKGRRLLLGLVVFSIEIAMK